MANPFSLQTMEAGTIGAWNFKEGDTFSAGDVLAEIETDKATMGFEAQDPGVIAKILVQAGTEVSVGAPIVVIADEDEDASEVVKKFADFSSDSAPPVEVSAPTEPAAPSSAPASAEATAPPTSVAPPVASAPAAPGGRVFASPFARKLAREAGFDIQQIAGSGPNSRVVASDVKAHSPPPAAETHVAAAAASNAQPAAAAPSPGAG
jgi:pyruvate dehydrogenase E2 component (dihydrolipoamide acetyltransferase)